MTIPSYRPGAPRVWDDPRIIAPDAETWTRMSLAEREAACERIEAVLDEYREAMSEGTRHVKRKNGITADLDAHFRRAGRRVYVGSELAVLYPGEAVIVPDVLAVLDCDPDYEPERWIVVDEKRGVDIVIEVRNLGKKHKDLVENVRDYARVKIPEYFSFDCRNGYLRGWRLAEPAARSYVPIVPQRGYLRSEVLGLDLRIVETRLRFFANEAMIPTETELVTRLQALVDDHQGALDDAVRQRDEASRQRDEASRQRDDVADTLSRVQVSLARSILDVCRLRGIVLDDPQRARIVSEASADTLARWNERAFSVASGDELLARD